MERSPANLCRLALKEGVYSTSHSQGSFPDFFFLLPTKVPCGLTKDVQYVTALPTQSPPELMNQVTRDGCDGNCPNGYHKHTKTPQILVLILGLASEKKEKEFIYFF